MKKTGIIVGRFQCSYLHEGHVALLNCVSMMNDEVVIFIGHSNTRLTKNNPLSLEMRVGMIQEKYPNAKILPIPDFKDDKIWSEELDFRIITNFGKENVTLYGVRDSFIPRYSGVFITECLNKIEIPYVCATDIRTGIHQRINNTKDFREGVIHASGFKYPTSYQTVDVAIINHDTKQILLGRKKHESKFRFIGGFIDSTDISLEQAAKREAYEECNGIETDDYKYIGSFRIDDWRYRKEGDKIMTAFFSCSFIFGRATASDDIQEVKWFDLHSLTEDIFEPEHIILFKALGC